MGGSGLKILYLAKYAPETENYIPTRDQKDGVAPIYHYEIFSSLKYLGHQVTGSRSLDYLISNHKDFDFVFSLYNIMPFNNCEVFPSALCEYLKMPYLGASPIVRSIAEDKNLTKIIAQQVNVDTPQWTTFNRFQFPCKPNFPPPYFIKPRFGASSEFIDENSIAYCWEDARKQIVKLQENSIDVIIEEFIEGINLTLPIIFTNPVLLLPTIMAVSNLKGNMLSFSQKRMIEQGIIREVYTNKSITSLAQSFAMQIYSSIKSSFDYARFDFRYDPNTNRLSFLEFNVCSNLGSHSSICQAAEHIGLTQTSLVDKILNVSLSRQKVCRK